MSAIDEIAKEIEKEIISATTPEVKPEENDAEKIDETKKTDATAPEVIDEDTSSESEA